MDRIACGSVPSSNAAAISCASALVDDTEAFQRGGLRLKRTYPDVPRPFKRSVPRRASRHILVGIYDRLGEGSRCFPRKIMAYAARDHRLSYLPENFAR